MLGGARRLHFDLHARHIDAGGTLALAGLAGDAEAHRLGHLVGGERVLAKLAGNGEPQRIGAAARDVALVARDAITRAHRAAGQFAAGAVVVAHLDGALETAAGAGKRRPVEMRLDLFAVITGLVTEQTAVIELRRPHHLAGIVQALRIEAVLDVLEGTRQPRAEHRLVEFRTHQTVAVFAGMRALVFAHHRESFFGDRAHGVDILVQPQIQNRPHVQAARTGMRVPGAARAVLFENRRQPRGVAGQMLKRHRAVLDEGDGFPRFLHRHHDVEAGCADFGDRGLQFRIEHLDNAAPARAAVVPVEAEIADQRLERAQAAQIFLVIVFAEFDQQHRGRRTAHELLQRRAEDIDLAGEFDHRGVDQLNRDRLQTHNVLRAIHSFVEAAEVNRTDRAAAEQRRQLQFDAGREGERALATDQNMREVDVVLSWHQRVEIVAADAALHFRKPRSDFLGLALADDEKVVRELPQHRRHVVDVAAHRAELGERAIGEQRIDRDDIVAHGAVLQRTAAAGIVARHATDGGARRGRDVDRKPQTVRLELAVKVVEHDAGLDRAGAAFDVEIDHTGQIFGAVDHQRIADGLPGLGRAAAAGQHGDPLCTG